MVYLVKNEKIFNSLFKKYSELFTTYKDLAEGNVSEIFISFDIRFRLAIGLKINYNNRFAPFTKSDSIKKVYQLLMTLNEFWFVYEILYKLCNAEKIIKTNKQKVDAFTNENLKKFSLLHTINSFNDNLYLTFPQGSASRNDLINFISFLQKNSISKAQQHFLHRIIKDLNKNKKLKFNEIFSIIYAIRNLYVHNAKTAKAGVKTYKTKITLLENCYDFLLFVNFKIINFIFENKIKEIKG
jgi:hypothetical protein